MSVTQLEIAMRACYLSAPTMTRDTTKPRLNTMVGDEARRHVCDPKTCFMWTSARFPHYHLCVNSGKVHCCGKLCTYSQISDKRFMVCELTGEVCDEVYDNTVPFQGRGKREAHTKFKPDYDELEKMHKLWSDTLKEYLSHSNGDALVGRELVHKARVDVMRKLRSSIKSMRTQNNVISQNTQTVVSILFGKGKKTTDAWMEALKAMVNAVYRLFTEQELEDMFGTGKDSSMHFVFSVLLLMQDGISHRRAAVFPKVLGLQHIPPNLTEFKSNSTLSRMINRMNTRHRLKRAICAKWQNGEKVEFDPLFVKMEALEPKKRKRGEE